MEKIENQIKQYKNKITELIKKLNDSQTIEEQKKINSEMIKEQEFLNNLYEIYNDIKIENSKTNSKDSEFNNNKTTNVLEEKNNISVQKSHNKENKKKSSKIIQISENKNGKYNSIKSKNKYKSKSFDKKECKIEIEVSIENVDPKKDKKFEFYFKNNDILSTFYLKKNYKDIIYFECGKKRNGCKGKIKYNINKSKWYLTNECNGNVSHETYIFSKFYEKFTKDELSVFNMNLKQMQKYYSRALFKSNESIDINSVKTNFKNKFNFKINLTNNEISKEKYYALGGITNLDIDKLLKRINNEEINLKIKSLDIFYDYKLKNTKIEKREEKVYFLTTNDMEEKLKDKNIVNYFVDITYKIIPKNLKKYKLMTITGVNKITNISYICCFILLKYEDVQSFINIFKYLKEMYSFNPGVVNIDYSSSLTKALKTENIFENSPIIVHCFFHFCQAIVKHMKKYDILKTKMSKYAFEILKNVELICFIPYNFIKSYSNFLKNRLTEENEIKFYNYLDKNWLKKEPSFYNYYELFDNVNLEGLIPHFYITNNIAESLHSKLGLYLPYKKVTNNNFIISIRNIIVNYETKSENIIRKDYVTKSLITYSKTIKKNKYEWLKYEKIKELEKKTILESNDNIEINVVKYLNSNNYIILIIISYVKNIKN